MHENRVAGPHLVLKDDVPVAGAGTGVRGHQARKVRLLLRGTPGWRIDVQDAAAGRRLRLGACPHLHQLHRLTAHPIRILHRQADFVRGVGIEVEDAAGKPLGHRVGRAEDLLAAHAQQRQRVAPLAVAGAAVADVHGGVAVVVAADGPFESQADQRRRLDDEFAGTDTVLGAERRSGQHGEDDRAEEASHGYSGIGRQYGTAAAAFRLKPEATEVRIGPSSTAGDPLTTPRAARQTAAASTRP